MKQAPLYFILLVSLMLNSCTKQKEILQVNQKQDRPTFIQLPDFSNYNISIPDVPLYTGPEPDPNAAEERRETFKVEPGTNQLQDIINAASAGDRIVLKAGTHVEDETLVINRYIKLRGEDGAQLSLGGEVGIYVYDARKTSFKNLEMTTTPGTSSFGILVEKTKLFEMKDCKMTGFLLSVTLEDCWKARINDNEIIGYDLELGIGITVINGNNAEVSRNSISMNNTGIWATDKDGKAYDNELFGNVIGILLCKVPGGCFAGVFQDSPGASDDPATRWKVKNNNSYSSFWGYLVIDGAKDNRMSGNEGHNNVFVDIELAGETNETFGFTTPTSEGNKVDAEGLNYIDCGKDNEVRDGVESGVDCTP